MKRVVLSFMVSSHTKFDPDLLFAVIAHRFYCTDVFITSELLRLIVACGAVLNEVTVRDMRLWRKSFTGIFKEIPKVTEWNLMEIQSCNQSAITYLKVKRSSISPDYLSTFSGAKAALSLLKDGVPQENICAPGLDFSVMHHEEIRKKLSAVKLRSVTDMYESYISKDRWPRQLLVAILESQVNVENN